MKKVFKRIRDGFLPQYPRGDWEAQKLDDNWCIAGLKYTDGTILYVGVINDPIRSIFSLVPVLGVIWPDSDIPNGTKCNVSCTVDKIIERVGSWNMKATSYNGLVMGKVNWEIMDVLSQGMDITIQTDNNVGGRLRLRGVSNAICCCIEAVGETVESIEKMKGEMDEAIKKADKVINESQELLKG